MEQNMFCYQCQETAGCSGCTKSGVCGKRPETAALQDLLIWTTKGLSAVTTQLRREGKTVDASVNHLITENLFTTITNVNFDDDTIRARIEATLETKALLAQLADCSALPETALWNGTTDEFAAKAVTVGVLSTENEDIRSLRELITYGLKGLAAYTSHANVLLKENEEIDAFLQRALAATLDDSLSAEELTALALETGSYGVQGMALLDEANTSAYGNPEITTVDLSVGTRPGILVSGHDLRDLEMLLEQTVNTGIDVYTHSEMLPAHYYPAFKKYPNFAGNYGNRRRTATKTVFAQPERFVIRDARTSTASSVRQKISLCSSNRQSTAHRRRNSSREPLSEASPMHRYSPWQTRSSMP